MRTQAIPTNCHSVIVFPDTAFATNTKLLFEIRGFVIEICDDKNALERVCFLYR